MDGSRTYRKLRYWVVDDVERVVPREVEDDLNKDRSRVDHRRLDDKQECAEEAEFLHAARLPGDVPDGIQSKKRSASNSRKDNWTKGTRWEKRGSRSEQK